MSQSDAILLVVSVLEGRNFPNLSSTTHVTVEARFDGEVLVTDPVELSTTPDINQELAWEIDRKTFHHHKIQRSVIKCNVYGSESAGNRVSLGYFIVDIRPLTNEQTARWFPLLQTKFPKQRPEISICAYIEDDQVGRSASPPPKPAKNSNSSRSKSLAAIYVKEKGFYQLGPDSSSAEIFSLSIRLEAAENLPQLIPGDVQLQSQDGYFLSFSLFDRHVRPEKFLDLTRPEFLPFDSTFRIRSTFQTLRSYLSSIRPVDVELRTASEVLAKASVPLSKIFSSFQQKDFSEKKFDGLTEKVRATFEPSKSKVRSKPDEENAASLNVKVNLSRENDEREEISSSSKIDRTESNGGATFGHTEISSILKTERKKSNGSMASGHDESSSSTRAEQPKLNGGARLGNADSSSSERIPSRENFVEPERFRAVSHENGFVDEQISHHYCFSIELRALRNLRLGHPSFLYCRYVYPFLGTSTAILTNPPLPIPYTASSPPNEHLLPNGLCIFNFAVNSEQLFGQFSREPLRVEIFARDQERKERKDQMIGLVNLSLEPVLHSEKQRCASNPDGIVGWRQTWTEAAPIRGSRNEKLGELCVTITLEDLGVLHLNDISGVRPRPAPPQQIGLDAVFHGAAPDAQLQAAYELQLWKETKEIEFEKHLREVEAKKVFELMEAFKEKDRERESLLQKKMKEYGELEKQMKKTLIDLEKREKQLIVTEQEIQRMQIDLKREYEAKYVEIREASKRLQEQSEHQINLEKSKIQALEEEIARLKRSAAEWEKRYRDKEHEFFSYKDKQRTTPEVKLQAEINMLTLEKTELQRKLESSMSSVERYKQQWLKALKEYQRLKQREQEQSKVLLQRQQQELEHMRLRYLAAEENDILKGDHKQLETIKNELNKLREKSSSPTIVGDVHFKSNSVENNDHLEQVDQQLGILIEHRDTLLQTGTYTHNDALIQELERRIQEAMKRKSSSSESAAHSHRYQ